MNEGEKKKTILSESKKKLAPIKLSTLSKSPNFNKFNYFKSELQIRDHLITEENRRRNTLAYVPNPQEELNRVVLKHFRKEKQISGYKITKKIGEGQYGKVYLAKNKGQSVAIKVIDKKTMKEFPETLQKEARILTLIKHPNIIKLYNVIENADQLYLIMEYADGGDLNTFIKKKSQKRIDEPEAINLFGQITDALDFCHKHFITHRDLKPENILMTKDKRILLCDFGFSVVFSPMMGVVHSCGTLQYSAPEVFSNMPYFGPQSDIWSLGVILFEMVSGKRPFEEGNEYDTYLNIKQGIYTFPQHFSPNLKKLISLILVIDPKKRPSLETIINHIWMDPWTKKKKLLRSNKTAPKQEENKNTNNTNKKNTNNNSIINSFNTSNPSIGIISSNINTSNNNIDNNNNRTVDKVRKLKWIGKSLSTPHLFFNPMYFQQLLNSSNSNIDYTDNKKNFIHHSDPNTLNIDTGTILSIDDDIILPNYVDEDIPPNNTPNNSNNNDSIEEFKENLMFNKKFMFGALGRRFSNFIGNKSSSLDSNSIDILLPTHPTHPNSPSTPSNFGSFDNKNNVNAKISNHNSYNTYNNNNNNFNTTSPNNFNYSKNKEDIRTVWRKLMEMTISAESLENDVLDPMNLRIEKRRLSISNTLNYIQKSQQNSKELIRSLSTPEILISDLDILINKNKENNPSLLRDLNSYFEEHEYSSHSLSSSSEEGESEEEEEDEDEEQTGHNTSILQPLSAINENDEEEEDDEDFSEN